jgi:hypothetical protein
LGGFRGPSIVFRAHSGGFFDSLMPDGATCSLLALFLIDALIEQCKRVLLYGVPYRYVEYSKFTHVTLRVFDRMAGAHGCREKNSHQKPNIAKNSQVCAELGHT